MLNKIQDNLGATRKKMRVGRGIGSGKGKTSGRGVKGYKARSGSSVNGFEGGQMPLHMRLPKRGFKTRRDKSVARLNLCRLEKLIQEKKIDVTALLDAPLMEKLGLIRSATLPVKLLGTGEISSALTICVDFASETATKKIVAKGGQVQLKSAQ